MTGLQDIAGARVVLGGTLYKVVEIAVGENFAVVWPNPFGGSGTGGGADSRFFDEVLSIGSNPTLIGARALYDLYISQPPEGSEIAESIKNISEILRHFSLRTVSTGSVEQQYIQVDIGFAGLGFGSFGGVAPGGGGGGGGGSAIPTDITNAQNGQILVYNSSESKWKNETPTLNTLNGVNVLGATDGQYLGYNAATGTWIPKTLTTYLSSVSLAQGSAGGSLKLIVDNVSQGDVIIKGWDSLGTLAFKDVQYALGTATTDARSRGMLKGVTSFSSQLDISSPLPGADGDNTYIYWDIENGVNAWHVKGNLIVDGFGSFGGANPGSSGTTLLATVWNSLKNNNDSYANDKINPYHIPIGDGLSISGNKIVATISGTVGVNKGGTGLTSVPQYALLYGAETSPLATLAPNTTTTKKFLTMTGTGSIGAAPAWGTIAYSDITNLSSWTGSSNITTLGTITTGVWHGTAVDYDYLEKLYIGATEVHTDPTELQNLSGLTNITAGGTIAGAILTASTKVQSPKFYLSSNVYFELDANNNVHLTAASGSNIKPGFYADGFGSFGGLNGSSITGTTLPRVWESLQNNTDYPDTTINPAHIPYGAGLTLLSNNIVVNAGDGLQLLSSGALAVNATVVRTDFTGGILMHVCATASDVPAIGSRDANTLYIQQQ